MSWFKKQEKLDTRWQWGALAAFIVMLVVNGLAGSTTLIGGINTAGVSDSYPNLFAPAGITFAIWGVIYALLTAFTVRMFGLMAPKKSPLTNGEFNQVIKLFTVSSVLNMVWLFAWQYKLISVSVVLMIALLVTLLKINSLLRYKPFGVKEYCMVRLPFSIYFGWITVATIANITTWLVSIGWNGAGLSNGTWMVAVLIAGAVIGIMRALVNHDPAYLAVFVWAYAGIMLKHTAANGFNGRHPMTIITLSILLAVFIAVTVQLAREAAFWRKQR